MKAALRAGAAVLLVGCGPSPPAISAAATSSPVAQAFGRLKSLEGAWTAYEAGKSSDATVELVARGRAVLQRSGFAAVYSVDGESILLTLFTDDGITERLRWRSGAPMDFSVVDVQNRQAGGGYAEGVTVDLTKDGFVQRWRWVDKTGRSTFEVRFARRSSAE